MPRWHNYGELVQQRGVEINLLPLIDCMLFLVIFFISTSVFVEQTGVDIQKPRATSATQLDRSSLLIAISADGQILYGGHPLELNAVRGVIAEQLREKPLPVVILADERARTGKLVSLIDECKLAGAGQVSLAATQEAP